MSGKNRTRQTARRSRGGGTVWRGRGRGNDAGASGSSDPTGPIVFTTGYAIVAETPVSPPSSTSVSDPFESDSEDAFARARLPQPLPGRHGAPLVVRERIGGMMALDEARDPRLTQMSMGFPISVHPLRIPNTRAMWSSASSTSVVDIKFVRLAGLLHKMLPLRPHIDDVQLSSLYSDSNRVRVYGRVEVRFDASGYEFRLPCWVIDLRFPVEILLGSDWAVNNEVQTSWTGGGLKVTGANARRVRDIQDVYITE